MKIQDVQKNRGDRPKEDVTIVKSGELPVEQEEAPAAAAPPTSGEQVPLKAEL